jgi:DNA polymerase-1
MTRRVFLVDGMSTIFRAYYAIRGLATSRGFPTNAIYGFTTMLRKLILEEKPEYLAVVFDTGEPTFRHKLFPSYKANRAEMPDDLALQIPYIHKVCEALGVPTLAIPGYEADDVIGTLARRAADAGMDVVIVSNDKDLCQLVSARIRLLKADRHTYVYYDEKGVEEWLGVRPDQVVDLLALRGDSTDNIPGAPGIGEKGAVQILRQFGTLEEALAHWEQVAKKSYRESLRDHRDLILTSRELVTIRTDLPVEIELEQLRYRGPDPHRAYALFTELEFTSLLKDIVEVEKMAVERPRAVVTKEEMGEYRLVSDERELRDWMERVWAADRVAFSLAMSERSIRGIALALEPRAAIYVDLATVPTAWEIVREILENGLIIKCTHDAKSALQVFASRGIEPAGMFEDSLIAAWLLDPNRGKYDLRMLAREYLRIEWEEEPASWRASARAADVILRVHGVLARRLAEMELERVYREIELPLIGILAEMERIGIRVDVEALQEASEEMEREIEALTRRIHERAGREFNINSPQQVGEVLEEHGLIVTRRTKKTGRISTSADVLEELAGEHELPRLILDYRELVKLKGTYLDALPRLVNPATGRVHTTFHQTGTATGRLSSASPNLQNIPVRTPLGRRIRRAFVAEPGWLLLSADYSQIELRILAHLTGDPEMTEAFRRGLDIHAHVARTVFGAQTPEQEQQLRRLAKIVNFGIAYSIGAFGLAQRTGLSRREAQRVIENYYRTYRGVRRFMEEIPQQARRTGYVRTLFGRIRPIPDIANKNPSLRARAEREAINAPVQGTAADLVKLAMIGVHRALRKNALKSRLLLQVHDELLLEVPEEEREIVPALVKTAMENVYHLSVPLLVEVGLGRNWMEAKGE